MVAFEGQGLAGSGIVLVSGSRDGTVRFWQQYPPANPSSSRGEWFCSGVFAGHKGQVSCVGHLKQPKVKAFLPSSALAFANGLIVSGGVDKTINLYEPVILGFDESTRVSDATFSLVGHTDTVCALDIDATGQLIASGSWDK